MTIAFYFLPSKNAVDLILLAVEISVLVAKVTLLFK